MDFYREHENLLRSQPLFGPLLISSQSRNNEKNKPPWGLSRGNTAMFDCVFSCFSMRHTHGSVGSDISKHREVRAKINGEKTMALWPLGSY